MVDQTEAFAAIWGKATGGRTVAVDPNLVDTAEEFTVPPAPGVGEACDWLREAVDNFGPQRMVFLVGGPGGGKSHALTRMCDGLAAEDAEDTGLARRAYSYRSGTARLTVVNDASIRSGLDRHPLADDIDRAAAAGDFFLGCVNRGILVEETHALHADSPGSAVVRWLAGLPQKSMGDEMLEITDHGNFLERATLSYGDASFDIVVVSVDFCSLFEPRPTIDSGLKPGPYKVRRMKDRTGLDLDAMPAGALFNKVFDHLGSVPISSESGVDPIEANIESLQSRAARGALLTVLRSAEAVAGGRLTFRELWGVVLRVMAGDLPRNTEAIELAGMFPPLDPSLDAVQIFTELRHRSRVRFSQALFGADLSRDDRLVDPVLRFTASVDPILDAVPGRLDGHASDGWASPVLNAFSGLTTSASPLETLLSTLPDGDGFSDVVTRFDLNLDRAFVAVTQPEGIDDRSRRGIIAWYGDYLSRLYAVSNGVAAFRPDVSVWLETRGTLPSGLEQELKTLLRPTRDPGDPYSGYLLPLFSSRTIPLTGPVSEPQLALKGEAVVELKRRSHGDAATVEMREGGVLVGEIELDFALIRSARACAWHRLGVTEQAARVGPRVERFRAKRLTPERVAMSDFRLVSGRAISDVHVEE